MSIPKRNIEEIKARYELEPELNDVYLEGAFDKEILDAALRSVPEIFRPCYAIDDIDVNTDVLSKYHLTNGNRQRVMALAGELSLPVNTSVRLVVDRDFEDWLPTLPRFNGLVATKFCDVETVYFHDAFVRQVMIDASRCRIKDWDNFFEALKARLCELYCLRLEIEACKINSGLIDFTRCLTLVDGLPILNVRNLIDRSLSGCCNEIEREELMEKVERRIDELAGKPHQLISRGHDFIKLVAWCIRKTKGIKSFQDEQSLTRLLVLFAGNEKDDLLQPIV